MKNIIIALVVTVVVVGGFLAYEYMASNKEPSPPGSSPVEETSEEPMFEDPASELSSEEPDVSAQSTAETAPVEPPPGLNESDAWLAEKYKETNPFWDQALQGEHLIRKAVTATDLIHRGENPGGQLSHLRPKGSFLVERRAGKVYVSPKNYERYTPAVKALETLGAEKLTLTYEFLLPLFREAYDELGNENTQWEQRALETMDQLISMEISETEVELLDAGGVYIFADESYEDLPPAQKILIRMGPENARRVQARLLYFRNMLQK